MVENIVRILTSALLIVGITEVTKRAGTLWGGVLASLPLVSIIAFVWLYVDTRDSARIGELSWSIFWMVLPSLALFACLPALLKRGIGFPLALGVSAVVMGAAYILTITAVQRIGGKL